jgi:hypothetical protein
MRTGHFVITIPRKKIHFVSRKHDMKPACINCKYYKVVDALSGYCRAETAQSPDKTEQKVMVRHDHACPRWADCGQHYYIRLGWLKAQQARQTPDTRQ